MVTRSTELYHYGKLGMKWGVRRYQNEDGTLTNAGKKRYSRDATEKGYSKQDGDVYYKTSKKNGREDLNVDANRYVKEDLSRTKKLADASATLTNKVKAPIDNSIRNAPKQKMDLSSMSDQQLRDGINRAMLERQYNELYAPKPSTKGREFVSNALEIGGNVLSVGSTALDIALAIKELRG
jgi:hypothetical protein